MGQFQKPSASITAVKGGHVEHFLISNISTVDMLTYTGFPHVYDNTR